MACLFTALCYAEFASMIPVAGSAYSYGTLGELLVWIIGWDLILEYLVILATFAVDGQVIWSISSLRWDLFYLLN